jgi:lipid-A-disaccharide synthase
MRAAGCVSWLDYEPLAVMGLVEVVRHLPALRRIMRALEQRLRADPPDLVIGVDAPDFNLRLLRRARRLGIPTVQYVCPSVWAWRSGRVRTIAAACDRVLCLLPFEAEFLARHAIDAKFVGHPLADELEAAVVAILPGSRRGEVRYLGPVFVAAMLWLRQRLPGVRFVTGAANAATGTAFRELCDAAGITDLHTGAAGARDALTAADTALVASGTVTLEAMLLGKPMVVAYKVSPLTAWLIRKSGLIKIERFALPNLLAGSDLVPELIQEDATGPACGAAVLAQLENPAGRAALAGRFAELGSMLRQSANVKAAAAVVELLQRAPWRGLHPKV